MKGHFGLSNTFTSAMKVSSATNTFTKSSPFDGTIYAVCGTSGQNTGTIQTGYPMPCMYFSNNTNNCSLVIDVSGDNFSCKYLASTGVIVDQFTIAKVGVRQAGPITENENTFAVYSGNNETSVNYYLAENAEVKIDLLNLLGEKISSFDEIPLHQPKGFYRFDLPLTEKSLSSGIYFVRMIANGKPYVHKVMISK